MNNIIEILGCSGSIDKDVHTTCIRVNESTLIDAGTGLLSLTLNELEKIDYVFLTHSHIDHILALPLMADSIGSRREKPIEVLGCSETIATLKKHIFNGLIWPDFSILPSKKNPYLTFKEIMSNSKQTRTDVSLTPFYVNHTVKCFGYKISSNNCSIIFSADTGPSENLIDMINKTKNLKAVIIDVSFADEKSSIAKAAKHFHPANFLAELKKIKNEQKIYITHAKPGNENMILEEINANQHTHKIASLSQGQIISF